jgi:hypothetical protein
MSSRPRRRDAQTPRRHHRRERIAKRKQEQEHPASAEESDSADDHDDAAETHVASEDPDAWAVVSDDRAVVESFSRAGAADLDAGMELAELLRQPVEGTAYAAWLGSLARFYGPEGHPEYAPDKGPLASNRTVFRVPHFTDRHHGWDGDGDAQHSSITVAFVSFLARTINATRVCRSLVHSLACLYPRVDEHIRRRGNEGGNLCDDPLGPFLQLAEAVHAIVLPLDMTTLAGFRSAGTRGDVERHADIWATVGSSASKLVEWWSLQIREGAYPPSGPRGEAFRDRGDSVLKVSYAPAVAHLQGWVDAALAGRLSGYPGAEPQGQAAASWCLVALLGSSLMAETGRMLAALGTIMGTHIASAPKVKDRAKARTSWRIAWDAAMAFFRQPDKVVSPVGLSQFVGMGQLEDDAATGTPRVRFPALNGMLSKALGMKLEFAGAVREVFLRRRERDAEREAGMESSPGAASLRSASAHSGPRSEPFRTTSPAALPHWPKEPLTADANLTHAAASVVVMNIVPEADAWEYCTYGVMMLCLASVSYRMRRRPLLYMPPCRWDVLVAARSFLAFPEAIEAPVNVATAPFSWELTRVVSRNGPQPQGEEGDDPRPSERAEEDTKGSERGEGAMKGSERGEGAMKGSERGEEAMKGSERGEEASGTICRRYFTGGAVHVSGHTAEIIRPVSFVYTTSSRRSRKAAHNSAPTGAARGRLHGQLRSVVVNPCAWGPLGAVL